MLPQDNNTTLAIRVKKLYAQGAVSFMFVCSGKVVVGGWLCCSVVICTAWMATSGISTTQSQAVHVHRPRHAYVCNYGLFAKCVLDGYRSEQCVVYCPDCSAPHHGQCLLLH